MEKFIDLCGAARNAFERYEDYTKDDIDRDIYYFERLSSFQQSLCPEFVPRLKALDSSVEDNATFINKALEYYDAGLKKNGLTKSKVRCCEVPKGSFPSAYHQNLVHNIMTQLFRDWSKEGAKERKECYGPILEHIENFVVRGRREAAHVLVPGSGLSRLAWEIARLGCVVDACECSHPMLLISNYILSSPEPANVHPFVHGTSDLLCGEKRSQAVLVPDVVVSDAKVHLSDVEFVTFCKEAKTTYDCIATCFFIDTAYNIFEYLESIVSTLSVGGFWINSGPLHWVQSEDESIRLTMNEIISVSERLGLKLVSRRRERERHYCSQEDTYMPMVFDAEVFVFLKEKEIDISELEKQFNSKRKAERKVETQESKKSHKND